MPAFNPYYPQGFNPYQQYQPQQQQNSFIHVQSEEQARSWNVALGTSVTFIDDNRPYCYTKSMGLSQLEPPIFKKFKLVEEAAENTLQAPNTSGSIDMSDYVLKADFEAVKALLDGVRADIDTIRKDLYNEPIKSEQAT